MKIIVALGSGFFAAYLLLPLFFGLGEKVFSAPNYQSKRVLNSAGVWLSLSTIVGSLPLFIWYRDLALLWLFSLSITFLGLLDDLFLEKTKGIRGHLQRLRSGVITTGVIKLGYILLISFGLALLTQRTNWYLDAFLLSIFANTVNTLDTRPNRANFFFGIMLLLVSIFTWDNPITVYSYVVAGSLIVLFPYEKREKTMLGDSGANLLGAIIGLNLWGLSLGFRIVLAILALIWQIFADNFSLNRIIDSKRKIKDKR
jgi:UDP-GlcNAc:undecaprenyl-phosphate GlcNAc-1-phosphate transferase